MYSVAQVADMLGVSKETLRRWDNSGKLPSLRNPMNNYRFYNKEQLRQFEELHFIFDSCGRQDITTTHAYKSIELFAGAGGLAIGLERAGLDTVLLNEIDQNACATLMVNRPHWNVQCGDIAKLDFTPYLDQIDVVTGGFPCQAFSYAGKKMGFEDARGTLFFEFARAIKETNPKLFMAENVRGLLNHDDGKTLANIRSVIDELGYTLLEPHLMKAIFYRVPQKRERLLLVGIRNDLAGVVDFHWPRPYQKIYTVKDALKAGELFACDVPVSAGQSYPDKKAAIMAQVPPGGYWRDLPEDLQKAYMQKSYYLSGGKTGMARRMHWDEPCLTLTCAPAQKQTERCHPEATRPFTVREYARIQTFPDDWTFKGALTSQYKQIGNAVPVNMAYELGLSVVDFLNRLCATGKTAPAGAPEQQELPFI
ncbi:MAG: DNA (cytosine-5-)-methyltransferase [Methylovulum sp.]|nr:DNA (cytosine-5-)-methyltransferase [Methylovulum sp.]